jgi:hypothetical protein
MSALLTPRRPRRAKRPAPRRPEGQSSLFGAATAPVVPDPEPAMPAEPVEAAVPETFAPAEPVEAALPETLAPAQPVEAAVPETFAPAEPALAGEAAPNMTTTASARRQGPTLDDLVAGAWEGLRAGAPAECLMCGTPLAPRHSAGAGIVGGRCGGCGSTLS